jgi:ABC-type transport system substrate-binding protein/DNA-binding SARP family transcriptional activator/DNA-binding beta-propeller fold protein YncE
LQDTSAEATVSGDRIEFRILGPLEVWVEDVQLRIGGPRQRALLAFLLLSANKAVSRDRLIDELFGDTRPASADHALRVQVSRLRKALDGVGGERLLASSPGYLLRVEPGEVDLQVFEQLLAEGRRAMEEGEADHAAAKLHAAEKLWRGRPLADLEFEPFARVEVERLEELRLAAAEARIEAELALGRHAALVPELEALVGEHPLRERLRSQLMLALYRSGRQADALAAYRAGRSLLSDHLALEPSPALRELEQAILRQDPALELGDATKRASTRVLAAPRPPRGSPPSDPVAGRVSPDRRRRHLVAGTLLEGKRSRLLMLAGTLVLIAVALLFGIRLSGGGHALAASPNSVGMIDGNRNALRAVIASGGTPGGIAYGAGAVWIADTPEDLVLRIDPNSRAVDRIPVGHGPSGVAIGDGQAWVVNQLDRTVSEINPAARKQVATVPVGNGASAIAFGAGSVWVANTTDNTISRIDPAAGTVVATIALSAGTPGGIAVSKDGVWVTSTTGRLLLVDPHSNQLSQTYSIGNGPQGVAVGNGSVWVANSAEGTVSRFDPGSGRISKFSVGRSPSGIAYGAGAVWVANELDGTVSRIDPRTGSVRQVRVGSEPSAVATDGKDAWVTVLPSPASHRGGTLRIAGGPSAHTGLQSVDPAVFDGVGQWLLLSLTSDGLVTYRHAGGALGDTLVPDLATSLPEPSDGGRTYTFKLHSGIRYSNGELVTPGDFRRAIERAFVIGNGYVQGFYLGIVGGPHCARKPDYCSLRSGIVTDDEAGTVTFHLRAPDPEFLYKLAFPMAAAVPAGTPDREIGRKPLPATGPYMTKSFSPSRSWVLVRNRRFREWSADAQPAGYPNRIVMATEANQNRAVRAIEHGATDVLLFPPSNRVAELATLYTSQLHSDPSAATFALAMNTRVPPFDRLAVRRALNYAVDRNRIAGFSGGPLAAQATCQILPPNLFGYRPYCPYTLDPGPGTSWTAPDLATAEQLVRSSGTRGMRVAVLIDAPDPAAPTEKIGAYIVSVLDRLGYRASLKVLRSTTPGPLGDSGERPQIGWFTWFQDYPAPSNTIDALLSCHSFSPHDPGQLNFAEFCHPKIDGQIRHAEELQTADPTEAGDAWGRIDHELVDQAPWVPLYNPRSLTALSARVGNYQYHPFWQVLLDQLWVR